MSVGEVFGKKDLTPIPPSGAEPLAGGEGETDWLGSIERIIGNIDGLFETLISIQEKYPQMVDKWKKLEIGKGGMPAPGGNPGGNPGPKQMSHTPEQIYAKVLNVLFDMEKKSMTAADMKKLAVEHKAAIIETIREYLT